MKLYRFSPIQDEAELREAVTHIHFACHELCRSSFGRYLPNAGNMGVFCHYHEEWERLVEIRKRLAEPSENPDQKYFRLYEPIVIPTEGGILETVYEYLYIRKPDPYRAQAGDIDFYLDPSAYSELKSALLSGALVPGARIFPRNDLDMIELYNPDSDVLAYVSEHTMSEKVRVKLSNETNL